MTEHLQDQLISAVVTLLLGYIAARFGFRGPLKPLRDVPRIVEQGKMAIAQNEELKEQSKEIHKVVNGTHEANVKALADANETVLRLTQEINKRTPPQQE